MLYEVVVPDGCVPGQVFQVQIGSSLFNVTAPADCRAGDCFSTLLDATDEGTTLGGASVPDAPTMLEVEIPPGCFAGDEFIVESPDGQTLAVVVPDDSAPGMWLQIAAPAPLQAEPEDAETGGGVYRAETAAFGMGEPVDEPDTMFSPDGFDFDDSYLIQRSDGSYSSGWLKSYDASTDLYHVLIPRVGYKYVAREQIELDTVHF